MTDLNSLFTPCLIVDVARLERNGKRMLNAVKQHEAAFRPHFKTLKCVRSHTLSGGSRGSSPDRIYPSGGRVGVGSGCP